MGLFHKLSVLFSKQTAKNFTRNIKFLLRHELSESIWQAKDEVIEDCAFELDELREMLLPLKPKVYSRDESLSILEREPKSFARIGDGEIGLMEGKNISFQKYDKVLAEKMLKLLTVKRDDVYVGICNYFRALSPEATERSREFHRRDVPKLRRFLLKHSNPEIQYLNAGCLMGYFGCDYESYSTVIERKRKLFEGRKIALVTGESVKAKWDYDVFELAESRQYIQAPSMNAFQEYDSILDDINHNVSKDTLVCLILGPTATAMAADLTDMGYMAWDVGHIAKDYDVYMKRVDRSYKEQCDFFAPD